MKPNKLVENYGMKQKFMCKKGIQVPLGETYHSNLRNKEILGWANHGTQNVTHAHLHPKIIFKVYWEMPSCCLEGGQSANVIALMSIFITYRMDGGMIGWIFMALLDGCWTQDVASILEKRIWKKV